MSDLKFNIHSRSRSKSIFFYSLQKTLSDFHRGCRVAALTQLQEEEKSHISSHFQIEQKSHKSIFEFWILNEQKKQLQFQFHCWIISQLSSTQSWQPKGKGQVSLTPTLGWMVELEHIILTTLYYQLVPKESQVFLEKSTGLSITV